MFYLKSVPKAVLSTIDKGKSSHVRFFWKSRVPYWTTDLRSYSTHEDCVIENGIIEDRKSVV